MSAVNTDLQAPAAAPIDWLGAPPAAVATTSSRTRHRLVLLLACAVQSMVAVDIAIVNVAVPSIQRDLGGGESTLQWVVIAYGLLLGGFLLLGGRMTDLLGRRRSLLAGLGVFTGASLLAGVAQHPGILIAARAVQGLGAALLAPAALSLLAVSFPEGPARNRALGILGAVGGAAGSVGVVASGLLAAGPGWRWAFFINIPVGLVLIGVAGAFLPADRSHDRGTRLDVAGATTATGGLLVFVYALHHAAEHGWTSGSTLALFATAVAFALAFVRVEAGAAAPLVPAAALRSRTLIAANVTAFLSSSAFLAFIFLGSLLMQQELGYSPTTTGLSWLATTTTCFAAAALGGRLAGALGVQRLLVTGLSLIALGALWLARVPADAGYVTGLLPAFILAGIGFGVCAPSLQIGALSGVAESVAGLASGLVETMREIGGAAGVAAIATVLASGTGLDGFHAAFVVIGVLAIVGVVAAAVGFPRRTPASD
jgi:EmrB/QacA subfamily drug resistance transporter